MTKKDKLLKKLISRSTSFSYDEMKSLLTGLGYNELTGGKTSGSRVAFYNSTTEHIIRLHKPHPSNQLKKYQVDYIIEELKNSGIVK